jgi:hypothetical protein
VKSGACKSAAGIPLQMISDRMMCSRIIHDAVVLRPLGNSMDLARGVADTLQFVVEVITSSRACKSRCQKTKDRLREPVFLEVDCES